ncbi:DNA repair protein rhp26 [Mucor velutinosus]|uniref:DNA repair protein rhp26 n=1 Tax=Mucor velutinosus TaxID=708070 RepID=A0AAN7HNL5_9FUNG|nr:DNA repair protein rhp26 [Mucor velutinosus]
MPGFVLEEPFPLARFHNTVGEGDGKHFVVGLNSLESTLNNNSSERLDDADLVAITVQGEGFKIYNTTDQKCTKSWITPPGIAFVGPATHIDGGRDSNAVDYTYAIVASGPDVAKTEERKTIWLWKNTKTGDNEEIDKTVKSFDEHISAIHVSPSLHSHVIIVSESGSIELATKDLDRLTAKQKAQKNGNVIWSTVFVTSNAHARPCCIPSSMVPSMSTIVVTVSHVAGSDAYTIKLNYVNVERRSIDVLTSINVKLPEKPVAFTLDPTDGRFTILGAAGNWTVWRMQLKHSSSKKISGSLNEHLSIQLNGYRFQDDTLGNIASVTPLSDSYVAMIAPRTTQKGDVEHVVSVWDVKYGTLQAEQFIKMTEKNTFNKNSCVYNIAVLPNSHLAVTVSSIVTKSTKKNTKSSKKMVDTNSVVMLCPYYSEPVSLMAAMGKMKQTVEFMGINNEISSEENIGYSRSGTETVSRDCAFHPDEDSDAVYDKWVSRLEKYQKQETNTLSKLMADDISGEEFSKVFFEHVNVSTKPAGGDAHMSEASLDPIAAKTEEYRLIMQTRFSNTRKADMELSQFFTSNVITKCFQQGHGKFWPVDVILFLMSRSLLRSNYSEKGIISSFLERKEWSLIPIVLEKVHDIPENDLVTLIKALIALYNNEDGWKTRFSTYMKMVVDAPRNDIFLQQSLKRINAPELPIILETIVNWLKDKSSNLSKRSNIVDFANSILDIHFPTLILEPKLQEIAHTLRELVAGEIEVIDDLEQLRNILGAYDRKNKHATAKRMERQTREQDAPVDELTKFRKKNKGKFGGEQGIPVYRVEVFRF